MIQEEKERKKQEEIEREISRRTRFRFFREDEDEQAPPSKPQTTQKPKVINKDLVSQISEVSDSQIFGNRLRKPPKIFLDKVQTQRSKYNQINIKSQKISTNKNSNDDYAFESIEMVNETNRPSSTAQNLSFSKHDPNYAKIQERVIKLK